jgi:hypothetical protein
MRWKAARESRGDEQQSKREKGRPQRPQGAWTLERGGISRVKRVGVKQSVDLDKSRLDGALRPDWSIGYAGRSRFVAARGDDYYFILFYLFEAGGLVLDGRRVGHAAMRRTRRWMMHGMFGWPLVGDWKSRRSRERGSVRRANHRCAGRMGSEWIARD